MFYALIFAGLAVLLVAAVLAQRTRRSMEDDAPTSKGTDAASSTPTGSAERRERKRRRAQSRQDRRKRH